MIWLKGLNVPKICLKGRKMFKYGEIGEKFI